MLATGEVVTLRPQYAEEALAWLQTGRGRESGWIIETPSVVYFQAQNGEAMPLVTAPPPSREAETVGRRHRRDALQAPSRSGHTVHLLIDQSGSMATMNDAAFQGLKELIDSLSDDTSVIVSTFNHQLEIGACMQKHELTHDAIDGFRRASGTTALFDAIVRVATHTHEHDSAEFTLAILTDGQDTASRTSTREDARRSIERLQSLPHHRVLFLGSNQDAVLTAATLGIPVGRALEYGTMPEHMTTALRNLSENIRSNRAGAGDEVAFTSAQRQASVTRVA